MGRFRSVEAALAAVAGTGGEVDLDPENGPYLRPIVIRHGGTADHPVVLDGRGGVINLGVDVTAGPWRPEGEGYVLDGPLAPASATDLLAHHPERAGTLAEVMQNTRVYLTSPVFINGEPVFCDHAKGPAYAARAAHGGYARYDTDGRLFVKFPHGLSPTNAVVVLPGGGSFLASGLQVQNTSHVVVRRLTSVFSPNDGFNFHGHSTDIRVEQCCAMFNGDEGVSSHDTCAVTVVDSEIAFNGTQDGGITDVNAACTTYERDRVHQNRGPGFSFKGARHAVTAVVSYGNGGRNLPAPAANVTVSDAVDLGAVNAPGFPAAFAAYLHAAGVHGVAGEADRRARFLAVRPSQR